MIDEWRLLIVEVKNVFLHKSTIVNRNSARPTFVYRRLRAPKGKLLALDTGPCCARPSYELERLMIDEWRLLIVEVKNAFLHKSTIINRQSQFSSTNLRLSAQQNNKASTTKLTSPAYRLIGFRR